MSDVPKDPSQPRSPAEALAEAEAAFARGNYEAARRIAAELARNEDAKLSERAEGIIKRTTPPPLTHYLLGLTFALLVAATWFAYSSP